MSKQNDKRWQVWKTNRPDSSKNITGFDTLLEAQAYLAEVCDDVLEDGRTGLWFIQERVEPIFLEIIDWHSQLEPMAVC
jgi:hypothetical protein